MVIWDKSSFSLVVKISQEYHRYKLTICPQTEKEPLYAAYEYNAYFNSIILSYTAVFGNGWNVRFITYYLGRQRYIFSKSF